MAYFDGFGYTISEVSSMEEVELPGKDDQRSKWLIVSTSSPGGGRPWRAVSRDFVPSQYPDITAWSRAGLVENIVDYTLEHTTRPGQPMFTDTNGEPWVLTQTDGYVTNVWAGYTAAYDGRVIIMGGASNSLAELKSAIVQFSKKFKTPLDPPASIVYYGRAAKSPDGPGPKPGDVVITPVPGSEPVEPGGGVPVKPPPPPPTSASSDSSVGPVLAIGGGAALLYFLFRK